MRKFLRSEDGSVTIEATISLVAFLIAIMFIYSQIKVLICECIMQNAVNNMAKETASYVYVLDRMGMVLEHSKDENQGINNAIGTGEEAVGQAKTMGSQMQNMLNILGGLFDGENPSDAVDDLQINAGEIIGTATSMKDTLLNLVGQIEDMPWETELKQAGVYAGEALVKKVSNKALDGLYHWKLAGYLPMEEEKFKRYFMIDGEITFENSRVFPDGQNNSVFVAVEYDTTAPFKFIPLKRHVCKYAYTAAWVSSNTNDCKS